MSNFNVRIGRELPLKFYKEIGDKYDISPDSYISLVSLEEFKQDHTKYIDNAKDKRDRLHEFNICKRM